MEKKQAPMTEAEKKENAFKKIRTVLESGKPARQAGLSDDLVSSFRDYATKLLSTKQSPEPHLAPLIVRESPGQYSQSVVVPSKTLPLKRYLDYKINSNPQPHYTGIHEGAHMSTLNYDPATEYRAYGQLILNPKAKTAITKLMNNADDLAAQLEVDPQKIKILRDTKDEYREILVSNFIENDDSLDGSLGYQE